MCYVKIRVKELLIKSTMGIHPVLVYSTIVIFLTAGCAGQHPAQVPQAEGSPNAFSEHALDSKLRTIRSIEPHLDELDVEFHDFPLPSKQGRDYFNAEETAAIERLLFRFVANQTALWDLVHFYGGLDSKFSNSESETKAHVLSIMATLLLASHTAFVVAQFADDPIAIEQMNQAYYRSDIPFGTYDRMRVNVTAPDILEDVAKAKTLYAEEMADPQSPLSVLADSDTEYAALIRQIPALQHEAEQRLQQVAQYFPSHAKAEALARKDSVKQHKTLYAIRSFLFKEVSRLKSPTAHLVTFSNEQKRQIFELLEPGDLILTYTAGYMSDVFIPGAFKHGITYVGSPKVRETLGIVTSALPQAVRYEPERLSTNLKKATLHDGKSADMIEAVAEGVIFNNLEHIMDTHVNRMLVLRPRLSDDERATFVVNIFSYLGDGYDFRFDFSDASLQVCTEVIYRAIDERGSIDFTLTERAGHETLSADDIANYFLNANPSAFEFVLFVEENPQTKNHEALIWLGDEGRDRLESVMSETN